MLLIILDIFYHFKKCAKKLSPQEPEPELTKEPALGKKCSEPALGKKCSEPEPPHNRLAPKPCLLFYLYQQTEPKPPLLRGFRRIRL